MLTGYEFLEAAYMAKMSGGGNIKPLTITKNGTYTAADDVDGYSPILVNVEPVIRSIKITQNGTYTAPNGVDGYNPVIVNSPYETLYKQEHGITENVDTGVTDNDGNNITVDGIPVGTIEDINDLISNDITYGDGDFTHYYCNGSSVFAIRTECTKTGSVDTGDVHWTFRLTATNLATGQTKSVEQEYNQGRYLVAFTLYNNGVTLQLGWAVGSGGYPIGNSMYINLNDIGLIYGGDISYIVSGPATME